MNVKQCSRCPEYTEYYCHSCQKDLCQRCKLVHVIDLYTKHHEVTIYREKFNYISKREKCFNHRNCIYNKYCEPCEVPVCDSASDHKSQGVFFFAGMFSKHKVVNISESYHEKRLQHKDYIHGVRSETIYNNLVLLKRLPSDVQTCHCDISRYQYKMIVRGQKVKDLRDSVLLDEIKKIRILFQKIRKRELIARIQNYEENHEQSANRPVQFLRFIKNVRLPKIQDTLHLPRHCKLSITQEINIKGLIELLSEIQIKEKGKRKPLTGNDLQLTLKSMFTVPGVKHCGHISCVTPDRVWVSEGYYIILTDTTARYPKVLHRVKNVLPTEGVGFHTVNRNGELIYIDMLYNVKKFCCDTKTTTIFIKNEDIKCKPRCLFASPISGVY